nr:unnamed protein product [Callosobruchus chinensis]
MQSQVAKCVYPRSFTRHEQVILCRLRIEHTNLTHLYMLSGDEALICETCGKRLTVEHIIFVLPSKSPDTRYRLEQTLKQSYQPSRQKLQNFCFSQK